MKITCPTCGRSYALADDAIGSAGRDVRCSRCSTVWHARADREPQFAAVGGGDGPAADFDESFGGDPGDETDGFALDEGDRASFPDPDRDFEAASGDDEAEANDTDGDEAERGFGRRTIDAADFDMPHLDPYAHQDVESLAQPHRIKIRMRRDTGEHISAEKISEIGGPIMLAIAVLLVFAGIMLRKPIVEGVPDLAGVYEMIGLKVNLRGLEIENVRSIRDFAGDTQLLLVEGDVRNVSDEVKSVPLVRLALLGKRGEEIYTWTVAPTATELPAGKSVHFRTRLASPPELGKRLQVRFSDREAEGPGAEVLDGNTTGKPVGLSGIREEASPDTGTRE